MDRYYGDYRRFTYDFSYSDQEEYSRYEEELDNLEMKEIISDEEYNNNISRLEASNNMDELEIYRNGYISESEYFFTREELLDEMKSIELMYRVTDEQLAEDRRIRAEYSKEGLRTLKRDYEAKGMVGIMRELDIDSLSDEEAISVYRNIRSMLTYDPVVKGREDAKVEKENQLSRRKTEIRQRIAQLRESNGTANKVNDNIVTGLDSSDEYVLRTEIEDELEIFRNTSDRIKKQIETIDRGLKEVIVEEEKININDAMGNLGAELTELREIANVIISDMDTFRLSTESADFSMSVTDIRKMVNGFTSRFKDLKVLQVERYNAKVKAANDKIRELKQLTDLEPEIFEIVNGLTEIDKCNIKVRSWTQTNYLDYINYERLDEVNKVISRVNETLNREVPSPKVEGLDEDISYIESELKNIAEEIIEAISEDVDLNIINQNLGILESNISDFELKLESNKDNLTAEEYENYKDMIERAKDKLLSLRGNMKNEEEVIEDNDYNELEDKTSKLEKDLQRTVEDIESFYGHMVVSGKELLLKRLNTLEGRISELKTQVLECIGLVDNNQFKVLLDRNKKMDDIILNAKNKLKDPGMIKNADIFSILNEDIDNLKNNDLANLEEQIKGYDEFIQKEDRKKIDIKFINLKNDVKRLEVLLENYKEKDINKYNSSLEKIAEIKSKLDVVEKEYRSKCPLMIKAVKSAKKVYKKYKKGILIAAGIAAFALVSNQVLIPAIIHGNLMIGSTVPVMRPFLKFSNKILGGLIGASIDAKGMWILANGTAINPSVAATSLLKGLAISGGSTALIAQLVIDIKKLIGKMKIVELKNKLIDTSKSIGNEIAEKSKNSKNKISNEIGKISEKGYAKKADKDAVGVMASLFKEYRNSTKSIEEFAIEKGLTDDELAVLRYLEMNSSEYNNSRRKGR